MLKAQSQPVSLMTSDLPEKGPEVTATRMSARILFRKKLKGIRKSQQQRALTRTMESMPDIADSHLIQMGHPAHKVMFLRLLGLIPISDITHPIGKLTNDSTGFSNYSNSSRTSEGDTGSDIDEDDLDLEVVFCPLDIPEIYEEITKKCLPGFRPSSSGGSSSVNSISSMSESDFESGIKKTKRFSSSLTNFDHHHHSHSLHFTNSKKLKPIPIRRPPMSRPQNTKKISSTLHKNKNHKNLSRSPKFITKSSSSSSLMSRRMVKPIASMKKNKTTFIEYQFDDSLDGMQVVPDNYSIDDPNSLHAIKMRLGMLHTELDFV